MTGLGAVAPNVVAFDDPARKLPLGRRTNHPVSSSDIAFGADNRPRIPDGEYTACYSHHETAICFRCPKVFVWFKIVEPGPQFEVMIYRAYRVHRLTGKPRRNGGFSVKRGSSIELDLVRILGLRIRPDRVSATQLRGLLLTVRTRTTQKNFEQKPLPEALRYSVVDSVRT